MWLPLDWCPSSPWNERYGDRSIILVHGASAGIDRDANQTADQKIAKGHSFRLRIQDTGCLLIAGFPAGNVHIVPAFG